MTIQEINAEIIRLSKIKISREKGREYYKKNGERIRAYQRNYTASHHTQSNKYRRKLYQKNLEYRETVRVRNFVYNHVSEIKVGDYV